MRKYGRIAGDDGLVLPAALLAQQSQTGYTFQSASPSWCW